MAKLTLTFNGKPIRWYQFEAGDCIRIGRDDQNDVQIDSLAVAPVHAEIEFQEEGAIVRSQAKDFPVQVNGVSIAEKGLHHGDLVSIGKHVLNFTEDATVLDAALRPVVSASEESQEVNLNKVQKPPTQVLDGQLQIMNGRNIGRVVSLKGGLTRLGKPETGVAVIAKRKDGFYVASLDGSSEIKLNNKPIQDKSIKLEPGDLLEIDFTEMQFFSQ